MVREHRSSPRFRARFDAEEPDGTDEPGGGPWGERFRAALRVAGVAVPERAPAGVDGLVIAPGAITATVDDGTAEPRRVRVGMRPLSDEVWDAVADRLAAEEFTAAAMALGRLPDHLEEVVAAAGGELLPRSSALLPLDCTCAEWSMPCAHVTAVCASAAGVVARDPFALVAWRGRARRELREAVRDRRAARGPETAASELLGRWYEAGAPVPAPSGVPARVDALLDDLPPLGADADPVDDDGHRVDAREALRPLYRRLAGHHDAVDPPRSG